MSYTQCIFIFDFFTPTKHLLASSSYHWDISILLKLVIITVSCSFRGLTVETYSTLLKSFTSSAAIEFLLSLAAIFLPLTGPRCRKARASIHSCSQFIITCSSPVTITNTLYSHVASCEACLTGCFLR